MKSKLIPALTVLLAATGPSFAGLSESSSKEPAPATPRTGHWRFSGGAAWRSLGDISWDSGAPFSSLLQIPAIGTAVSPDPLLAGPANTFADRTYNDGFVRISPPTTGTGETWNWGYDNGSQVAGGSLSYHGPAGNSVEIINDQTISSRMWGSSDTESFSPYLAADYMLELTPSLAAGPQFSFMFMSFDAGNTGSNFSAFQERREFTNTLTDTYDLRGVIPPQAPYAGTSAGPGPLIANLPANRDFTSTQIAGERLDYTNSISENLDVNLSTLSLGGQMEWHRGSWSVRGGAGVAVNIASADAHRVETLRQLSGPVIQRWENSSSNTRALPGLYLSLEAALAISDNVSLSLFGRHDWSKDLRGSAGPSTYEVDLDGWTAGVVVNVRY